MKQEKVFFRNKRGEKLTGLLDFPDNKNPPIVICLHGMKAHKNYHSFTKPLVESLVRKGIAVLQFDFHAHGESEGDTMEFTRISCADDVAAAIDFLEGQPVDMNQLCVFGTSMGAVAAVIHGCREAKALVFYELFIHPELWSDWFSKFADEINESGYMTQRSSKEPDRIFKFSKVLYDESVHTDLRVYIKNVKSPTLLIYGTTFGEEIIKDTTSRFDCNCQEVRIDAPHVKLTKKQSEKIAHLAVEWFKKYL